MRTITSVVLMALLIVIGACTTKKNQLSPSEIKQLTPEAILQNEYFLPLMDSLNANEKLSILNLYQKNNFHPIWYDTSGKLISNAKRMDFIVHHSLYYGLPSQRILKEDKKSDSLKPHLKLFLKDVQMTLGILRTLDDINNGFSDPKTALPRGMRLANINYLDTLRTTKDSTYLDSLIHRLEPQNKTYSMLSKALKLYVDTADLSMKLKEVPLTKEDSIQSYVIALENLATKKFKLRPEEDTLQIIRRYQRTIGVSPNGKIDQATQHVLEETPLLFARRIALYMEKSRNVEKYPKCYVIVNIPEFKLFFFNKDTVVSIHNVVVGKLENNSPTLSARIYAIQTFPYWNVPHKIAVKEILPAIKRNRKYLEQNNMELLSGKKVVDAHSVNWKRLNEKNFWYSVRQKPGEDNSLGIIKFEFYNKYDVYIHDTPQKHLLNASNRAYSHGCIRCQYPIDLAHDMLTIDKNITTPDSLDTLLARKTQDLIKLKRQIPIYLEYNSISISPVLKKKQRNKKHKEYEDKIVYNRDIYFKDDQEITRYFGV